jgi:hypothetical protein
METLRVLFSAEYLRKILRQLDQYIFYTYTTVAF